MPTNPSPNPDDPRTIPNAAFVRAVRDALDEGATDDADGGVPVTEIAARLGVDERYARLRLGHLVSAEILTRVWGRSSPLDPKLSRPRVSYLLPDEDIGEH